jgi:gliding motility-associated lipoprotein GldH
MKLINAFGKFWLVYSWWKNLFTQKKNLFIVSFKNISQRYTEKSQRITELLSSSLKACLLLTMSLMVCTCVNINVYEQNVAIDHSAWPEGKILRYEYNSTDTITTKLLSIGLRHTGLYPYSNIYLFITTIAPNGKSIKDTVEYNLVNDNGKWIGSGIGDICDLRLSYKHKARFGQQGKYIFYIQHGMRDDILSGILDVGIRIEDAK